MNSRAFALALIVAPMVLLAGLIGWQRLGQDSLLPGLDVADVEMIELERAGEKLVIIREGEGWIIPSAADAPGDSARIERALDGLKAARGTPLGEKGEARREPLKLRLLGRNGKPVAEAAFWTGVGQSLPDGPLLQLVAMPALPSWPSAWSSLQAPRVDPATVASVAQLTTDGIEPLDANAAVAVAKMLGGLSATGFVAASDVNWAGGHMLRVTLTDGRTIDLLQVPDGEQRYFLRLASDNVQTVRETRRFAFRVSDPLP